MAVTTLNSATSAQPANSLMGMLPDDWSTNYDAGKKIDWYNTNNIGVDQLLGAGVGGADIQWMTKNGYTGGGAQDSLYNKVPDDWFTDYDAAEKIDWYNTNNVGQSQIEAAGGSGSDVDWMRQNGYTGAPVGGSDLISALRRQTPQGQANPGVKFFENRTIPVGTGMVRGARSQTGNLNSPKADFASLSQDVVLPPRTTQPVVPPKTTQPVVTTPPPPANDSPLYDQLPDNWYSDFGAAEKINWYNDNNVTTRDLMEADVHAADIQWMIDNGYTAGNAQESLIAQLPDDWRDYGASEKINWYNDNDVSVDALLNEGVPMSDIEWMLDNGYSGTKFMTD